MPPPPAASGRTAVEGPGIDPGVSIRPSTRVGEKTPKWAGVTGNARASARPSIGGDGCGAGRTALLRGPARLGMRATGVVGDEERSFLVKERSGDEIKRYLEAHPEREEDLMTVLSYFDPTNFANDVRCPTLVGPGLLDDVVPAPTVRAIGGPHEVVDLPVSHTQLPEEQLWYDFEAYWFRLAVGGVPPGFGGERDLSF